MKPLTAKDVKKMRGKLGLTQEAFARLLGLSFVSINRWENGKNKPTGFGAVMLVLLQSVLKRKKAKRVVARLRPLGGSQVEIGRALVEMEWK